MNLDLGSDLPYRLREELFERSPNVLNANGLHTESDLSNG